jgi:transposase-like protein
MSVLSRPEFHDEAAAMAYVEAWLWPQGPVCPRCGVVNEATKLGGKSTRLGTYKCRPCRKPFTVKIGTIFEASHVPMNLWLQAIHLLCSSKKGISSNQLHRTLGVTLKTAWFMSHRIREAMRSGDLAPFGGNGSMVEADETFIGREPGAKGEKAAKARGFQHKMKVLSLVDRETKQARSFVVDNVDTATILPIVRAGFMRTSIAASIVRVGAPLDAYATARARFEAALNRSLGRAADSAVVARSVAAILAIDNPRLAYAAGREAALLARAATWLPEATFARSMRKQFGLN